MRLIESTDPEQVIRYNVRAHYTQRLVLVAAACRELQRDPQSAAVGRPQAALALLDTWMRDAYDLPAGRDIPYRHGLDDPRLAKYASDLQRELELGTTVCEAHFRLFTADTESDYRNDLAGIRAHLETYLAEFG